MSLRGLKHCQDCGDVTYGEEPCFRSDCPWPRPSQPSSELEEAKAHVKQLKLCVGDLKRQLQELESTAQPSSDALAVGAQEKVTALLQGMERFIANAQETASHYRQLLEVDGWPMDKFPDARGTKHHKLASSVIEYAIDAIEVLHELVKLTTHVNPST